MHHGAINEIVTLIALGAGAQWVAWRLRLPSILVLLLVGFVAGPVTSFFEPDELLGSLTFPFVALAAAVVLFEGGLTASWDEIRGVALPVRGLISIGIPVTWTVLCTAAHYLLGLRIELALLLGAILVVTGPTVIGPLLRHARPRGSVGSVLKLEGIINDPIGAILAVVIFQGIRSGDVDRAVSDIAFGVAKAAVLSGFLGYAVAFLFVKVRERDFLPDFLHNAVVLPFVLVVYATANAIQAESGLLAVTVMGIALASQKKVNMEQSVEFTEHARILLISMLFILLTARMELTDITELPLAALGFVAVVIFVARPLAVGLATLRSGLSVRERVFLAAMAPRGVVAAAVASLFGLELVASGYEDAAILMPVTFAVIAVTVLVSGLSAAPLVKFLGLAQREPQGVLILGANQVGRLLATALAEHDFDVIVVDPDAGKVEQARQLRLRSKRGEILSRRFLRDLDLDGIGQFVALTSNDDVNTLAAAHFRRLFGAEKVYQIQPSTALGRPLPHYATELRASQVAAGATLDKLDSLVRMGGLVTSLQVQDVPTLEELRAKRGPDAIPLFCVSSDGKKVSFVDESGEFPSSGLLVLLAPP